ncbi:hypothetical protein B9Z55_021153 [Caenorhabditis nigoni]|nr:hypothetical protein B9Z55_021153 [Caenorhabditis nigoni]
MNEAVVKEEAIEEEYDFAYDDEEFVGVKQEKNEEKPEHLLQQDIKTGPNDIFETNEPEQEFFDDIEQMLRENDSKIETVSTEVKRLKCEICQKTMPRNLLNLIKSEGNKIVLAGVFKIEGSLETRAPYVCISHIQSIIDDYDGKLKSTSTPFEQLLRTFISKHKQLMKERKSRRRSCQICHKIKECSQLHRTISKNIRTLIMVRCILRGTHSVEQAISYVTTENTAFTCYSHFKESIDKIFQYLGVKNIQELSKCSTLMMTGLMDIVKKIDSNFTAGQFIDACGELVVKKENFESNL